MSRTGLSELDLETPLAASEIGGDSVEQLHFYLAGAQTTGAKKFSMLMQRACTVLGYAARLDTAPVGSTFIIDINKNGTTIFTTQANRPTIADGANAASTTAAEVTAFAAGDRLTVDIDQIGSGTAGSDLMVTVAVQHDIVAD